MTIINDFMMIVGDLMGVLALIENTVFLFISGIFYIIKILLKEKKGET